MLKLWGTMSWAHGSTNGETMMLSKFFSRRELNSHKEESDPLKLILIEGRSTGEPLAIRMVRTPEYGGAWSSVGAAVPVPWSAIIEKGLAAFDEVRRVSPDSEGNTDLAPGKGKLRKERAILVKVTGTEVIISPLKRKTGRPIDVREEDYVHFELPAVGEALEQVLKQIFARI